MARSIDKRKYSRVKPLRLHIEYKNKKGDSAYKVAIINIGAGGLCFIRNSIINKGEILQIKFPFKSKKIILDAKVTRIEGREVAIKFLNSDEEMERFVEVFNYEYPLLSKKDIPPYDKLSTASTSKRKDNPNKDLDKIFDLD